MSMEDADALRSADRRSAFANAPMGVALTTPGGVLVDAHPAPCGVLGPPPRELPARTERELRGRSVLDLVHPDVAPIAREAHASWIPQPSRPLRDEPGVVLII